MYLQSSDIYLVEFHEYLTDHIVMSLTEKQLVHTKKHLTLIDNVAVPLLVISPNHGNVEYKWEKKVSSFLDEWKSIELPPWTCLLYATTATQYRCIVETSVVAFDVKGWYNVCVCIVELMYVLLSGA